MSDVEAREIVGVLPAPEAGKAVLDGHGELFNGAPTNPNIRFHEGRIRGAWPQFK